MIAETSKLIIREWQRKDINAYFATCNSEEVMGHLGGPRTRSAVEAEVSAFISQQEEYGFTLWVIQERSSADFLGFCGLDQLDYLTDPNDPENFDPECTVKNELELGFRLRSDRWNKGFATEGAATVLAIAFTRLRARRVVSRAARANGGSRAVLEKLGMLHDFGLDYWTRNEKPVLVYTMDCDAWLTSPAALRFKNTGKIKSH